jgi:hypothetical protein
VSNHFLLVRGIIFSFVILQKKFSMPITEVIMARGRSPNYPQLNIREAVDRAKRVYEKEHLHVAPKEVILADLGYKGPSGASLTVLASLRRYGLIEPVGDGLRVTNDAVTLIELNATEATYRETLRRLAFAPELFNELLQEFSQTLPSEATLRHKLIQKGFLPEAADEAIRIYRENIEIVGFEAGEYSKAVSGVSEASEASPIMRADPAGGGLVLRPSALMATTGQDVYTLPGRSGALILQWPDNMTSDDLPDIELWLDMAKRKLRRVVQMKEAAQSAGSNS